MLHKAKTLNGFKLNSLDGEIGKVKEFYFDDVYWAIRYIVVDTGNWLVNKHVLISPYALFGIKQEKQHIDVNFTKKQIEESPLMESDLPVSLQFENDYHAFHNWPMYWKGRYMWGETPSIQRNRRQFIEATKNLKPSNHHLRSTHKVTGYHIQATNGEIGHIDDYIIDDDTWAIRYIVIDTENLWNGKKVLIAPSWIEKVSWSEEKVFVNLAREGIERSPEYTDKMLLTRNYEIELHNHYNRQGYWAVEPADKKHSALKK